MGSHGVPGAVCGGGRGLFHDPPALHDHRVLRQETVPPQEREQAPAQTQVRVTGQVQRNFIGFIEPMIDL